MEKKRWAKRMLSGLLATAMLLSAAAMPVSSMAMERASGEDLDAYVSSLPDLEAVMDQLDEDEVVTAKDLEVEFGSETDLKEDFTNIEIPDKKKVTVTFYEAKDASKKDFSSDRAGTYKAVYYAEPTNAAHPVYRFSRNVTVKEEVKEAAAENSTSVKSEAAAAAESATKTDSGDTEESEDSDSDNDASNITATGEESDKAVEKKETASGSETASGTSDVESKKEESSETASTSATGDAAGESVEPGTVEELNEKLEEAENQDTYDEESGWNLSDVIKWAVEVEDIPLEEMELNEEASFQMPDSKEEVISEPAMSSSVSDSASAAAEKASNSDEDDFVLTPGAEAAKEAAQTGTGNSAQTGNFWVKIWKTAKYLYEDYDLGTYWTHEFTIQYGNNGGIYATAYCLEPDKIGPQENFYDVSKMNDNKLLSKIIYYGESESGSNNFFEKNYPGFSKAKRFILTHLSLGYTFEGEEALKGVNDTGIKIVKEMCEYCKNMPEIPDVAMSFSDNNVTAYVDGSTQRTKTITFNADELQTITIKLPSGVKLHNVTKGTTSSAGASVTIPGGTQFYFIAPKDQAEKTGPTWYSKFTGSITKDYTAYYINVENDEWQKLAFIFGETNDEKKTIELTVNWWQDSATVTITKTNASGNKKLAGAVYGIYSDKACTDLITKMPATDANGSSTATVKASAGTVYLKELTAPKGFKLSTAVTAVSLTAGSTVTKSFKDDEIMGAIKVTKQGQILTGATSSDNGITFKYENGNLAGASYSVTAGADITSADGTVVHKKGASVGTIKTSSNGEGTLTNLHMGTYIVTETAAPADYVNKGESKTVTLTAGSTSADVTGTAVFTDDRQKAKVTVVKKDDTTENPLSGGVFGIYAGADIKSADGKVIVKKDTFIEKVTTGTDGSAVFKSELPINNSYYVKEIQAPKNYYRNQTEVYKFTFNYTNEKQAEVAFSHTFVNERVDARIDLTKVDKETGVPQGDAKLEKAVYGLFAREDIVHPDGKTGVLYKADSQVATLTTGTDGKAFVEDLYLGKYYIKELIPSEGYLLDEKEYDIDCASEGDLVKTVNKTCTSKEQVIKQPFQVIKAADNDKTDADLLQGAGFSAYLISSLKTKSDGSYDFASAEPIVLTENGGTEMFTDKKGYARSIAIPYGKYIVRETTTPHNFIPVDDFKVTITENNPTTPQQWRVLLDDEFEAKLKIIKKDDETKKPVLLPATEFKVYDMNAKKYVEQVTTYPSVKTHTSYFTDDNGYLILPNNLKIGRYRIEEVMAPSGYVLNSKTYEIDVDTNTAYLVDKTSGDAIIEVEAENHLVKGKLIITKAGEVLTSFDKDFVYETRGLAGAEYAVYAAEDICTPDHQKDESGDRIRIYEKDSLVTTVTTDKSGTAEIEDLPLGTYRIVETKAPEGFVLNSEPQEVTFKYKDQKTPVIEQTVEFLNDRQKVEISVEKQDIESGKTVAGAVFGIYAAEDIKASAGTMLADAGNTLVKEETLLAEATSDEHGNAVFALDFPLGKYYVKEHKAPAGYISSDEIIAFDASWQGQDVPVVKLSAVKKNVPTKVEFTKSDITSAEEIDGAILTILTRGGEVIERWTTVKGEPHMVKCLTAGESYVLREETAPYGYLRAEDVVFTVEETGDIQKVEMQDKVPTALLIINKQGEFLDKVTPLDTAAGTIGHFFDYLSGNLTRVTFEVYAAEDIKAADGVAEDYFKKDELVGTITTDDSGIAKLGDLPAGRYYVKEKETEHGFVLDDEPRYIDLSYRDQYTPIVVYDEKWQNVRQKISIHLTKKETETEETLKGAIFGLYAAEDILSKTGEVLMEKDSLIEQRATDAAGEITFTADLPVDGKYYVMETKAPDGYVTSSEKQEFTFNYEGSDKEIVSFDFTFKNTPTTVELSKADVTTCEEIPGAKLQLTDKDGNVIDEWTSEETPHMIKKLVVGETYYLTERIPANGYATAETVEFTIENTTDIQKVQMFDEPTKVLISKTDITTCEEIPGAQLTIFDKDGKVVKTWTSGTEPYYIEKLPIGEYVLREELAPDGYVRAEDVKFTVKDTGIEQKVEMKDKYTKVQISKQNMTTCKEIPGAHLTLFDKDGKVVEKWVSTQEPHMIERLPVGEYMLREELAPDGYVRAEDVKFTVEETGEIQKVEMKDDYTKVSISKQDMTTCEEIPGAILTLFDSEGKEIEKWTSTDKPHYITMLKPGEYMLREELAPDGYLRAEDVKFTVEETGDIQKVYMKDAYTKVQISKTDMVTKEEIPGAKLTVFDKNGKKVTSWTSGKEPHMIERLAPGTYTLREELAPDGYLRAEDVKFTVEETGEIQKVAMVDDYTKVQISKTDMVTKKELPGAKLTVFDSDGKEIEKWTSGNEPHMIEKLKPGTYTLREVTAPDGYEVAEDVKFTVKETGEIQKVSMVDAPKSTGTTTSKDGGSNTTKSSGSTPSTSTQKPYSNPLTGDTTDIVLWIVLLIVGGVLAGSLWYVKREMDKEKNTD